MGIEERELRYSAERPLRAWRLFRVRAGEDGPVLSSPMYHDPHPPPWPTVTGTASCYEDHQAPAAGCRCGIYAVIPGTLDSLPGYLADTAHDPDPWAYAEIACSGRVFVDRRGVRVERAALLRIALPEECWPDGRLAEAIRLLGERYGVPVERTERVPAWVKDNLRRAGPPPDDAMLDLASLDLFA